MQINHAKAFAYAKFSDRREKSRDDDSDSGKGSSAAKRAAMEETIDDGQDKKKRGRKVYENPTNKVSLKTAARSQHQDAHSKPDYTVICRNKTPLLVPD